MPSHAIRRLLNVGICVLSLSVLFACDQQSGTQSPEPLPESVIAQPNILIILADDMGFGDKGAFGSETETLC